MKRNEPDVCFTWGGAHYKTFDGRYFYFAGRCTYKLVHDCQDQMFSVHVVNDLKCQNQTSCSVGVNLYLGGVDIKVNYSLLTVKPKYFNIVSVHTNSNNVEEV